MSLEKIQEGEKVLRTPAEGQRLKAELEVVKKENVKDYDKLCNILVQNLQKDNLALSLQVNKLRKILSQWVFVLDGQTEPVHPISYVTELNLTKEILDSPPPKDVVGK